MAGNVRDMEKEQYWREIVRGAGQSGMSVREYCLRHGLKESQFHWWQRTLKDRALESPDVGVEASFALVSKDSGASQGSTAAGIELLLSNGRLLRIARGVDEQTLRMVLSVAE